MNILIDTKSFLDLVGTIIVAGALVVSIATFYITFKRSKESEQMKIAHDIMRDFSQAEDKILDTDPDSNKWKLRHVQYLNISEWLSFLVNHGKITNKNILDYFKQLLIEDYQNLFGFPNLILKEIIQKTSKNSKNYTKNGLLNYM